MAKTYNLSFAQSLSHVPAHPDRTAVRSGGHGLDMNVTYREFSTPAAMRNFVERQTERRGARLSDFRAWRPRGAQRRKMLGRTGNRSARRAGLR